MDFRVGHGASVFAKVEHPTTRFTPVLFRFAIVRSLIDGRDKVLSICTADFNSYSIEVTRLAYYTYAYAI